MSEWETKMEAIINETIHENITSLVGVPSWMLVLLNRVLEKTGKNNILEVWPNLEVYFHGGVNFNPYREQYKKLIPKKNFQYYEIYNASEGFFGIQDDQSKSGEMVLLTDHGIFYEFIEMSQYGMLNAEPLRLGDVIIDIDYALIISTNSGLWRYDIGDTVRFTSTSPYRIKISGRTKHFINVFGEELMVGNTDMAIEEISKKHHVNISEYTAGPIFMNEQGKGGHEWVVEFNTPPVNIQEFMSDLDLELQNLNSDYKAKRQNDIALQELVLKIVPRGTFKKWMNSRGKLGGQNKVPRLSNSREYLEGVLGCI
jgi:hypothetical protein